MSSPPILREFICWVGCQPHQRRVPNHPRGLDRPGKQVFRWHKGGRLYNLLNKAAKDAGISLPTREAFHVFRHTYGTWMRRYAGSDTKGLVSTGAWKSEQSASRYAHAVVSEEATKASLLPFGEVVENDGEKKKAQSNQHFKFPSHGRGRRFNLRSRPSLAGKARTTSDNRYYRKCSADETRGRLASVRDTLQTKCVPRHSSLFPAVRCTRQ